ALAPGRIPRPAQETGPGGGVVGGGPQRDGGAVLGAADCDANWRHLGLAVRQHVGYPVEHRAHHVGGSTTENVVVIMILCAPAGWLRLVKDAPASTELGMICMPLPVSIWVARQFTSTTRPRAVGVSSQSP